LTDAATRWHDPHRQCEPVNRFPPTRKENIMHTSLHAAALIASLVFTGAAQAALHDRGGGLIYDDVLDITWLQNANYGAASAYDNGSSTTDGKMTWANAMDWAANLSYYDSVRGVTYDDWRLPQAPVLNHFGLYNFTLSYDGSTDHGYNIHAVGTTFANYPSSEMAYLYYRSLGNTGRYDTAGNTTGCSIATCLTNSGPFLNIQRGYWTLNGDTLQHLAGQFADTAITFSMDGRQTYSGTGLQLNAWAVRNGDVAPVPEPETWALLLAGIGLLGYRARRS